MRYMTWAKLMPTQKAQQDEAMEFITTQELLLELIGLPITSNQPEHK